MNLVEMHRIICDSKVQSKPPIILGLSQMKKKKAELHGTTTNAVLGHKDMRKQQKSSFLFQDLDAPKSRVQSTAENQNKGLYEERFDLELRNSQYQAHNVTISQRQCMNRSFSNFVQYHAAIVGNFDTILDNLGIPEDIRMNVTSSLTSKRYKGKISEISEDQAKKELWSFGIDPKDMDFAAAKKKLRQLGDKFSSIEPIKKYGKSVAETLNNHCDSAKLFKNARQNQLIVRANLTWN